MAVDPADGKLENPQSWNRYAYTLNNPYKFIDPDGRAEVIAPVNVQGIIGLNTQARDTLSFLPTFVLNTLFPADREGIANSLLGIGPQAIGTGVVSRGSSLAVTKMGERLVGVPGRGILDLTNSGIEKLIERSFMPGLQLAERFGRSKVRAQLGVSTQENFIELIRKTLSTGVARNPGVQHRFPSLTVYSTETGVAVNINTETGLITNAFRPSGNQLRFFQFLTTKKKK